MKGIIRRKIDDVLDAQDAKGLAEYGQLLDDVDVNAYDWKNETIAELADGMQYACKQIVELEKEVAILKAENTILRERLMKAEGNK